MSTDCHHFDHAKPDEAAQFIVGKCPICRYERAEALLREAYMWVPQFRDAEAMALSVAIVSYFVDIGEKV